VFLDLQLYLRRLHDEESGFTTCLCRDDEGYLTGVIWMSPAQRANWELYGGTLFLDMMKHELNSIHWPLVSIVAMSAENKVVTCAEALCCQERL